MTRELSQELQIYNNVIVNELLLIISKYAKSLSQRVIQQYFYKIMVFILPLSLMAV